jgi:hypothetical protein
LTAFTPFRRPVRSIATHPEKDLAMNPTLPSPSRRRGVLTACALVALLNLACATAANADSRLVQVDIVDRDGGETLRVWRDHGRPVVAGRPGARYSVRLVNDSGERVLAVVAIDGVNVVSGETASVGQRGYVLEPWQRAEITGWRKSEDEVAAFEFTKLSDSYAARTGRARDVGVIGVAVFREAPAVEVSQAPAQPRLADQAKAAPAPSADARAVPEARRAEAPAAALGEDRVASARAPERLGTGHGERETSVARMTTFVRASSRPDQRLEIRYDSLENLVAAGIVPPPHVATTSPHAFPADPPRGYVPDPPSR